MRASVCERLVWVTSSRPNYITRTAAFRPKADLPPRSSIKIQGEKTPAELFSTAVNKPPAGGFLNSSDLDPARRDLGPA